MKKIFFIILFNFIFCNIGYSDHEDDNYKDADVVIKNIQPKKCLIISSYSMGYEWQDSVIKALEDYLFTHCILINYELNSKLQYKKVIEKSKSAFEFYKEVQPDVIITSDNNAYTFFAKKYKEKIDVPIFSIGLNWNKPKEEGNYVLEVPPINKITEDIKKIEGFDGVTLIAGDTNTTLANIEGYKKYFHSKGIVFEYCVTPTFDIWKNSVSIGVRGVPNRKVIILQNNADIVGWDGLEARETVKKIIDKNHLIGVNDWMLPYVKVVYLKLPEEQSKLVSDMVIEYFNTGKTEFETVENTKYDIYLNKSLYTEGNTDE